MMVTKTEKESVCLFCSTLCPLTVEIDSLGNVAPIYRKRGEVGICSRGGLVCELLVDKRRLNLATVREKDSGEQVSLDEALRLTAAQLKQAGAAAAVLIDGNGSAEALISAGDFCKQVLGSENFVVFLPPADSSLLAGVSATKAKLTTKERVAEADVVLCLGDPFATHPIVARPIHEARGKKRGNRLVVVDVYRNRTAQFATDFLKIAPGTAHLLLGVLVSTLWPESASAASTLGKLDREECLRAVGLGGEEFDSLYQVLRSASNLAVVVSLADGRNGYGEVVGALVGMLCTRLKAGLLPLTIYGNAQAAHRIVAGLEAKSVGQFLQLAGQGKVEALLVVGVDLASALSSEMYTTLRQGIGFIASAAAMPTKLAESADVVLPVGMWFEEEGTALDEEVTRRKMTPLANPPAGAVGTVELFTRLAKEIGDKELARPSLRVLRKKVAADLKEMLSRLEPRKSAGDGLWLVTRPDPIHFAEGSLTGQMSWPRQMIGAPVAAVSPGQAEALGLADAECVKIVSDGSEVEAVLEIVEGLPNGCVLVSAHFPEVRDLLDWSVDEKTGELMVQPGRVQIQKESL